MNDVNLSVLFLSVSTGVFIGALVAAIVVFAAAGAFVGYTIYKKNTEKKVGEAGERVRKIIGDAEAEAGQIKADAQAESKRALKEALLEPRLWNSKKATFSKRKKRFRNYRKKSVPSMSSWYRNSKRSHSSPARRPSAF